MLPITRVTDFPPAVERTKKYVVYPSVADSRRDVHYKKWSALYAMRLDRAASCAADMSFARDV